MNNNIKEKKFCKLKNLGLDQNEYIYFDTTLRKVQFEYYFETMIKNYNLSGYEQ